MPNQTWYAVRNPKDGECRISLRHIPPGWSVLGGPYDNEPAARALLNSRCQTVGGGWRC